MPLYKAKKRESRAIQRGGWRQLTLKQVSGQSRFSSSRTDKVGQDCVHIQSHVIMNLQCRRGHQEREKTGEKFSLTATAMVWPHLKREREREIIREPMLKFGLVHHIGAHY